MTCSPTRNPFTHAETAAVGVSIEGLSKSFGSDLCSTGSCRVSGGAPIIYERVDTACSKFAGFGYFTGTGLGSGSFGDLGAAGGNCVSCGTSTRYERVDPTCGIFAGSFACLGFSGFGSGSFSDLCSTAGNCGSRGTSIYHERVDPTCGICAGFGVSGSSICTGFSTGAHGFRVRGGQSAIKCIGKGLQPAQ